jgi:aspartyl-tRNA(Asn)/glutamyl-tRNA(Gln) amidotransferase subunit B
MQEGSLRVDANVNLHIDVDRQRIATPIVEVKNMNSFRAVERALDYEAPRQYAEWQETGRKLGESPKQTRGWDDVAGLTRPQRGKEESSDYRYFPDPDLTPVTTTPDQVEAVRGSLGELPAALRSRLSADYQLSAYDADVLVNQGGATVDYFLAVADATGDPKSACNWITQQVLRELNQRELAIEQFGVSAPSLAGLIAAVNDGRLPSTRSAEAFQLMLANGAAVEAALAELKIERVDDSALVALVQELLAVNPKTVADIRAGKLQAAGALIGQAKKKNPNVDPNRVRELAIELVQRDGG